VIATNCRVDYSKRIVGCAPLRTCKHEWVLDCISEDTGGKRVAMRCANCGQVVMKHESYSAKPGAVITHF